MTRHNVLLVAYACEPGFSSEREVGWKWSSILEGNCNLFVLTRENNKEVIEKYLIDNNISSQVEFLYYDLPSWAKSWKKGERGLYLYYLLWQFFAALHCRRLHVDHNFHITHYLTFGSLLLPQFMFLMPTKYILGPVGGGENVPIKFIGDFSWKGKAQILFRHFYQKLQCLNPIFLANCIKADRILARTPETIRLIPKAFRGKTELFLETGVPEELLDSSSSFIDKSDVFTIVTVGRLIPTKVNILTLKSILNFKQKYGKPFRFLIVGDGPEKEKLEHFCQQNDLEEVVFLGWQERANVFDIVRKSHVYFSTTFKEGGTWAFFEAVALKIPIVCLKISGPDLIVSDNGGIKIAPKNPISTAEELSEGLLDLAESEELRNKLADNALEFLVENLSWSGMLNRIKAIYKDILR